MEALSVEDIDFKGAKQRAYHKAYREKNKEEIKSHKKEYYQKIKKDEAFQLKQKEYNNNHRDERIKYLNLYAENIKILAFNILGGCECAICGDRNLNHLAIDHINSTGAYDRKVGLAGKRMYRAIAKGELTKDQLKNLRVLCRNHNIARNRKYLDVSYEEQNPRERCQTKLWKDALKFFGPCSCGESELKFLTIGHLHDDGAERRRNGESYGIGLIRSFRAAKWPNSIKDDFALQCANCNDYLRKRITLISPSDSS
jgi:hypothetical protein